VVAKTPSVSSYSEYLEREQASEAKHEFLRGEIFAMAGGTPEHAALQAAVTGELRNALKGKPCRVYASDLRVRVEATDFSCYPDATVVCGKLETSAVDRDAAVNPKLVVEVLSDSTEAHDRGTKASHYRRIPTLVEYVFVSQNERLIEVYRKNERGRWELAVEARAGEMAELASADVTLAVDSLYDNPLPA
jgi:Uma2 family endonuclease